MTIKIKSQKLLILPWTYPSVALDYCALTAGMSCQDGISKCRYVFPPLCIDLINDRGVDDNLQGDHSPQDSLPLGVGSAQNAQ